MPLNHREPLSVLIARLVFLTLFATVANGPRADPSPAVWNEAARILDAANNAVFVLKWRAFSHASVQYPEVQWALETTKREGATAFFDIQLGHHKYVCRNGFEESKDAVDLAPYVVSGETVVSNGIQIRESGCGTIEAVKFEAISDMVRLRTRPRTHHHAPWIEFGTTFHVGPITPLADRNQSSLGCDDPNGEFYCMYSLGAEGTAVNELRAKETVRLEALVSQLLVSEGHWKSYVDGNIQLASTGELSLMEKQTKDEENDTGGIDQAFEGNLSSYWLRKSRNRNYYAGPSFLVGVRQSSNTRDFVKRYYGGVRVANAGNIRLHYFEILYGKTESLRGDRLEIRAQMPVPYRLESGNKKLNFIVGMHINFGVHRTDASLGDSLKLFVTIPIGNFKELWQ